MKRLFDDHKKRNVAELSGAWRFLADSENKGTEEKWYLGLPKGETVIVPSVWNNELSMLNYEGAIWYERTFCSDGSTLLLEFESVMTRADVWLDGKYLGNHYGAFSQFEFIVNNAPCGNHLLIVRADSMVDKQSIPQKRVDWFNYGGIARDCYVSSLKGICILSAHLKYELSCDLKNVSVWADLELYNAENSEVSTELRAFVDNREIYNENITLKGYEKTNLLTPVCEFDNFELWSTDNPKLYDFIVETESDDLIDKVGFRKIEARDGKIYLNHKEIELYGVNRHEEHPDWGFAFPAKLMKRDLDLICDLGCNTIRGAHYPQSRILIDMLDERGLLFWSEIPIWGGGFDDTVLGDDVVVNHGLEMHREMTKYYYNHPSIIIWGMHNEIYTLYPCTKAISEKYSKLLREKGGNRLITHAAAFPFDDDSLEYDDIICINMYKGWYGGDFSEWDKFVADFDAHRKKIGQENKAVIISEFGAGALAGFHSYFDTVRWSEEYQSDLLEYCLKLFNKTDYIKGFYIWQFANIRTYPEMDLNRIRCFNNKGILDEYRNPKSAYFKVRELYNKFRKEE